MDQEAFEAERPRLTAIAYSILGSVAEAEDAVQETWLRWERQQPGAVKNPHAWLATVVSRVAIDELTSARRRREDYVGEWLPEPRVAPLEDPADAAATSDAVEMALLVVLEQLPPAERAAFVLCDVFGYPATEAAAALGKSPEAARQLASRARRHVREARPPRDVDEAQHRATVSAFVDACRGRNLPALMAVLAPDVEFVSDGGGAVASARKPLHGRARVGTALAGFATVALRKGHRVDVAAVQVNGQAGVLIRAGGELSVYALETSEGQVTAMRVVRNPAKLRDVYSAQDVLLGR